MLQKLPKFLEVAKRLQVARKLPSNFGILLDKMKFYSICGLENDWFRSHLKNRKQFYKMNCIPSDIKDIGVPQGSCLGQLLFLLYINDPPFSLKKTETSMYADDTMISYSSKTLGELHMVLNAELVDIEKWLQSTKLSLNVVKTQALVVLLGKDNNSQGGE